METLIKKNASNVQLDIETFKSVTKLIANNLEDWKVQGSITLLPYMIDKSVRKITTKSGLKKIKKRIFRIQNKVSIVQVNNLLEYLGITEFGLSLQDKEESIIKSRKDYVKAREACKALMAAYKSTKGDYYKNKLN